MQNGEDTPNKESTESLPSTSKTSRWDSIDLSDRKSPIDKCPICLGSLTNRCLADNCKHEFCFICLLEWTKIKAECPLCKQKFKNILYNVTSDTEFKSYEVPEPAPPDNSTGRRFRFASTLTGERLELQRQIRELQMRIMETRPSVPTFAPYHLPFGPSGPIPAHHNGDQRTHHWVSRARDAISTYRSLMSDRDHHSLARYQRLFESSQNAPREQLVGNPEFRRLIYERGLRVRPMTEEEREGRTRDISVTFFRENPATIHRLVPWLTRELGVLLGDPHRVQMTTEVICSMLNRYDIENDEFRSRLAPVLLQNTDQFLHELLNFARSPFELAAYDGRSEYFRPGAEPRPVQQETTNNDGDDVIVEAESVALQNARGLLERRREEQRQFSERMRSFRLQLFNNSVEPTPSSSQQATEDNNQQLPDQHNSSDVQWVESIERSPNLSPVMPRRRHRRQVTVFLSSDSDSEETRDTWPTIMKKRQSNRHVRASSAGPSWANDGDDQRNTINSSGDINLTNAMDRGVETFEHGSSPVPLVINNGVITPVYSVVTPEQSAMTSSTNSVLSSNAFIYTPSPIRSGSQPHSPSPVVQIDDTPNTLHIASPYENRWSPSNSATLAVPWSPAGRERNEQSRDSDVEVLCEMKPKHLRTPPLVTLLSDDDLTKSAERIEIKQEPKEKLIENSLPGPSHRHSRERSESHKYTKRKKHKKSHRKRHDSSDSDYDNYYYYSKQRRHRRRRSKSPERKRNRKENENSSGSKDYAANGLIKH